MPLLVVKSREGMRTFPLEEGKPMFIGRADECDIRLNTSAVSRKHAVIMLKGGICGVKDLGSFNGTMLNDKLIQVPHQLTDDDVLKISSFVIRLYSKDPEHLAFDGPAGSADATAPDLATLRFASPPAPAREAGKSDLRLPRAMRQTPEQAAENRQPEAKHPDTDVFRPGKDTSAFIVQEAGAAPLPPPPDDDDDGSQPYFTPYSLADLMVDERVPDGNTAAPPPPAGSGGEVQPGPEDLSYFEESSLAPLFIIPNNADTGGESVLDRVKDVVEATPAPQFSSSAEAVIPLMDEAPLITSLEADASEETSGASANAAASDESGGIDTGIYALPPETGEAAAVRTETGAYQRPPDTDEFRKPDTDDYQRAPDTAEYAAAGDFDDAEGEAAGAPAADDADSQRIIADVGKIGSGKTRLLTRQSHLEGLENVSISAEFMACINTRLSLFSLLYDLVEERKRFRLEHPDLPFEVEQELARQDAELNDLPFADEADLLIQGLRKKRERIDAAARERESGGKSSSSVATSAEMRAAEELAVSQWMLIRDSNREALPAVYREAYRLAADEPLARELMQARIRHGRLMGGGVYLLALQVLEETATRERKRLAKQVRKLEAEGLDDGGEGGVFGMFGSLGKMASNIKNRKLIREEVLKLRREDRVNAVRAELAARETAFMLKTLAVEFRQLYRQVALRYVAGADDMPWVVRAFLRYGVIGFKPWWMREDVREFIAEDCRDNVIAEFERGAGDVNILYADEYLKAVSQMDVTPSPDENLETRDKNSVEWKTDRAYRRIVNARGYNVLMEEMLKHLDVTINYFQSQELDYERRITAIKDRGYSGAGESVFDMQSAQRTFATRRANMQKHVERIKNQIVPSILEAVEEAEGRFRKGELKIPDAETLVRREVEALADIRRRVEGHKDPFPPQVVRESFHLKGDTVNSRGAVRAKIMEMEALDPGLFINVVVPSQNKVNRIELRLTPTVIIAPAFGLDCLCSIPREGMEGGHLVVPTCFARQGVRQRMFANLLADFRWGTSRNLAGRDLLNSDTLAGHFMRLRRQSKTWQKARREKALYYMDMSEAQNWRRVYEMYLSDALSGGRQLYQRNHELYDALIGKFIDLPEGVRKIIK